jgi:hypothetical protein
VRTSNKLYQRVFKFKGGRDTANAETTNLMDENCLKTLYIFFYYVKHGNRVPTTEFAEKATFWAELMTDGRVGSATKVRKGDFEALLKKTAILVYSQVAAALCKALAVLNAPVAIILECEKFVAARDLQFHQDVPEVEAIEAVNALRRWLQGEQPPSGGKEEEPEDGKQKKGKAKVGKNGKKTEELSADLVGSDDENPKIDITDKEEVGVDAQIDLAGDDDLADLDQPRSSRRLRAPRKKPVPVEVVAPATKTRK